MKKQIRVVSAFILITFLFSIFVIPTNINAKVDVRFKQEVNFGEPGESPFGMSGIQNDISSVAVEPEDSQQNSEISKDMNIWYLYTDIILSQFFNFIF